jgi:hypothetical protein
VLDTFDATMFMLQSMDEGVSRDYKRFQQEFREHLGFDLREDLLGSLGSEMNVFATFTGRALIPDVGLLVSVKDKQKVGEILGGLWGAMSGGAPNRLEYQDHTLVVGAINGDRHFDLDESTIRPTFTFVDDYLLITLWPQAAKNLIASKSDGSPRFRDRAGYKELAANLDGVSAANSSTLMYVDCATAMEFVLDNATPFIQSFVPASQEIPLDVAAWPRTEVITKHLFGMIGAYEVNDREVYAEIYSPTGYVMPTSILAGLGMWMGMRQYQYFESGAQMIEMQAEAPPPQSTQGH